MADSQNSTIPLNPFALHLQKLALELKCSFCLNLYTKPLLLPCDHIFCSSCVPKSEIFGYECPLCKHPLVEKELRQASYMENLVKIYRCLDASFSSHIVKSGNMVKGSDDSSSIKNLNSRVPYVSPMGAQQAPVHNNSMLTVKVEKIDGSADSYVRRDSMGQDFQTLENNMSSGKGVENGDRDTASNANDAKRKFKVDNLIAEVIDDGLGVHLKKQKKQNHGLPEIHEGHSPPLSMDLQNSESSASGTDLRPESSPGDKLAVESDLTNLVNFMCAFCQTWKITEGSGPMQHFANGKEVSVSEAGQSNVIHVHKICIEWAPQVFFEDGNVIKNLDMELARAAKLNCSSCGLTGAALGCYVKSCRRSYHVPCAYEIVECRWDTEGYLLLCPSHTAHKFPNEKSKKPVVKKCTSSAKCTSSTQTYDEHRTSRESDFWAASAAGTRKWVLCGSALSADDKFMLVEFAKMCGATVTKAWNPNVTHVVASTDASGACSRTFKVLMAILNGRWILKTDWIKACIQSKRPANEEPYEISLDNHGCRNGPKNGRLRALNNAPQLFNGLRFFFTGPKSDIQYLTVAGGGTIIAGTEELKMFSGDHSSPSVLVVYNSNALMGTSEVLRQRVEAERMALESGFRAVAHTWILDSIASSARIG